MNSLLQAGIEWAQPASVENRHVGRAKLGEDAREDENIFYATLSTREKIVLRYCEKKWPPKGMDDKKRSFVLTRSLDRVAHDPPKVGRLSCILPNTKVWLDWKQRYLMPQEKMAMQGFFCSQTNYKGVPQVWIARMGGNAVSVPLMQAINFCLWSEFTDIL